MGINDHVNGSKNSGRGGNFQRGKRNPWPERPKQTSWFLSSKDAALVLDAVGVAVTSGCLISFSRTQDGGALCITIMDGDDRYRTYCTSNEEIESALSAVVRMFSPTKKETVVLEEVDISKAFETRR